MINSGIHAGILGNTPPAPAPSGVIAAFRWVRTSRGTVGSGLAAITWQAERTNFNMGSLTFGRTTVTTPAGATRVQFSFSTGDNTVTAATYFDIRMQRSTDGGSSWVSPIAGQADLNAWHGSRYGRGFWAGMFVTAPGEVWRCLFNPNNSSALNVNQFSGRFW